ncbi:hypothetical protein ACL02T_08500 [Pseudonocardia sp. RS010]|uniref:hypothetical protein n=1 Tax=Pseudonocardia sp. RS010 TaxID=3385979 RepID=UPI0039A30131
MTAARIAAVAAVGGALVGVIGAGVPALIQSQATREQFLREQQRAAYTEFVNGLSFHGRLIDDLQFGPPSGTTEGELDKALDEAQEGASALLLVGSVEAAQAARNISAMLPSYTRTAWLEAQQKDLPIGTKPSYEWEEEIDDGVREFVEIARNDLGVGGNPLPPPD